MMKSQQDSTDIYSEDEGKSQILLKIDSADPNWTTLFSKNETSDFTIKHRDTVYHLHRFIIFKHMNWHVLDDTNTQNSIIAPYHFDPKILTAVLSSLYGFQIKLCRSQVLQSLSIAHFLKIAKLIKIMQQDITQNLEEYQLFPLLQKAMETSMQEIKDLCLAQLELQNFEQMKYAKYELLTCHQQIFKLVIHHHNERRWQDPAFGQSQKFVQELTHQYCKHNNYNQRKKSQLIKSFNEMSLQQSPPFTPNTVSPTSLKETGGEINIRLYTPRVNPTESMIPQPVNYFRSIKSQDQSSKSMINLALVSNSKRKKSNRASQHNSSHSKLCMELLSAKDSVNKNEQDIESLKDTLQKLQSKITHKQSQAHNNKFRLSQIQKLLAECETQIMEDTRKMQHLQLRCNRVAFRKLRQCESFSTQMIDSEHSDSDQDKGGQQQKQKKDNPKDSKLRVSLIQSKWVCC